MYNEELTEKNETEHQTKTNTMIIVLIACFILAIYALTFVAGNILIPLANFTATNPVFLAVIRNIFMLGLSIPFLMLVVTLGLWHWSWEDFKKLTQPKKTLFAGLGLLAIGVSILGICSVPLYALPVETITATQLEDGISVTFENLLLDTEYFYEIDFDPGGFDTHWSIFDSTFTLGWFNSNNSPTHQISYDYTVNSDDILIRLYFVRHGKGYVEAGLLRAELRINI